jgi:hypothetical protein
MITLPSVKLVKLGRYRPAIDAATSTVVTDGFLLLAMAFAKVAMVASADSVMRDIL